MALTSCARCASSTRATGPRGCASPRATAGRAILCKSVTSTIPLLKHHKMAVMAAGRLEALHGGWSYIMSTRSERTGTRLWQCACQFRRYLKSAVLRLARCRGDGLGLQFFGGRPRTALLARLAICRLPSCGSHGHSDHNQNGESEERRDIAYAHRTDRVKCNHALLQDISSACIYAEGFSQHYTAPPGKRHEAA